MAAEPYGASASPGGGGGALAGSFVPSGHRPTDDSPGLFGSGYDRLGALGEAGAAHASRGGKMDFLGLPVRLAPSLSGNPNLVHSVEARKSFASGSSSILRPHQFTSLRESVFPHFSSVNVE